MNVTNHLHQLQTNDIGGILLLTHIPASWWWSCPDGIHYSLRVKDFCESKESGPDAKPKRLIPWSHAPKIAQKSTAYMDIFMDDFCGVRGNTPAWTHSWTNAVSSCTILTRVFNRNDNLDNEHRNAAISINKLQKGDASFQKTKRNVLDRTLVENRQLCTWPNTGTTKPSQTSHACLSNAGQPTTSGRSSLASSAA
jgi:hypothetical protein